MIGHGRECADDCVHPDHRHDVVVGRSGTVYCGECFEPLPAGRPVEKRDELPDVPLSERGFYMREPAKLVKDREYEDAWRVEWCDDDGGCEITVFAGPKAHDRARSYAELQYGLYQS